MDKDKPKPLTRIHSRPESHWTSTLRLLLVEGNLALQQDSKSQGATRVHEVLQKLSTSTTSGNNRSRR